MINGPLAEAVALREAADILAVQGMAERRQRNVDPTLVRDELLAAISDAIINAPRSLQKAIGPSEIGTACHRRLGFKLADVPRARPPRAKWRPTVGTAVHLWLANLLQAADRNRWLVEVQLDVGDIDGETIYGHCDVYDYLTAVQVDWKIVGPTSLKSHRANGISQQYRVQAHTYGRGWQRLGLPVDHVSVFFLPANGELNDYYFWSEPYDEQIAIDALGRADATAKVLRAFGPDIIIPTLPTQEDHCADCPWYNPAAGSDTNLARACPGHGTRSTRLDSLLELAGKKKKP